MNSPVSAIEAIEKAMEGVANKVTWSVEGYDEVTGQMNVVGNGFFIAGVIANQPDQEATAAFIAACNPVAMREVIALARQAEALQRRAEEAEALAERLKLEAQSHAQEARTANSTIYEIYQAVSGGKGEPGNWHGAKPVRAKLEALQRENAELREALKPFADVADLVDSETEGVADSDEFQMHFHDYLMASWKLSLFRRARALLGGSENAE